MFEYMTAQEAAEKWNVSLRWVQRLCKGNRIEGVMNMLQEACGLTQEQMEVMTYHNPAWLLGLETR